MKTKMMIRDQNGGAVVEFALILPLLIVLLFGSVEFGLLLYNKHIITNASREGARAGIVMRDPRLSDSDIKAIVDKYADKYLVTFGSGTISFNPPISPPESSRTGPGLFGTDLIVTVEYPYNFLVLFNPITFQRFDPIKLKARTVMRME